MLFEDLPTTPRAGELLDTAFSRAARAGGAKSGREAQESMLRTAANVLSDNVENVVTTWPDLDRADTFYVELADAVLRRTVPTKETGDGEIGGVDALRASLAELTWASRQIRRIEDEYGSKIRRADVETARKHRKQAFARMADVAEDVETDLRRVGAARNALRDLPEIRADEPTVVVAGYPNVGKSSFVNAVTRARNEIASYPFTTKAVGIGHAERDRVRYQLVDTPGLLDRPDAERNEIEHQAVSALTHLADAVLVLVDPSGACGYPLADQIELRDEIERRFDAPVLTVCNKSDRSTDVAADVYTTVTDPDAVGTPAADGTPVQSPETVLDRVAAVVDHDPEFPPSRREQDAGAE